MSDLTKLAEPVAWRYRYGPTCIWLFAEGPAGSWASDHPEYEEEPLYPTPPNLAAELAAWKEDNKYQRSQVEHISSEVKRLREENEKLRKERDDLKAEERERCAKLVEAEMPSDLRTLSTYDLYSFLAYIAQAIRGAKE